MKRISYVQDIGGMDIVVPPEMEVEFKTLVQRAINTWQDVSPEMRDFADRVLERESIVGSNMKRGIPVSVYGLATRSCCGTLLREPHHSQCTELHKPKLTKPE